MVFLHSFGTVNYQFDDLSLLLLMYADDLVIFSETVEGLQNMLDSLSVWNCRRFTEYVRQFICLKL